MVYQQVLFDVNGHLYGTDSSQVKYIDAWEALSPRGEFPACVSGTLLKRGEVIPVVNMRMLFSMPVLAGNAGMQILISVTNGISIGYLVDRMYSVEEFTDADFNAVPAIVRNSATGYVKAIAKKRDSLVTLVDFAKILPEEDFAEISRVAGLILEQQTKEKAERERVEAERREAERKAREQEKKA